MEKVRSLGQALGCAAHLFRERADARMAGCGVTTLQAHVILYLSCCGGSLSQLELGRHLRVKPSTVNGIVERLEEKRLLTRSVSPGDGRCKLLHLTEEGRCFYQEFIAITEEVHRQAEQGFSPEELSLLQELLHRVADNLTRETEEPGK